MSFLKNPKIEQARPRTREEVAELEAEYAEQEAHRDAEEKFKHDDPNYCSYNGDHFPDENGECFNCPGWRK